MTQRNKDNHSTQTKIDRRISRRSISNHSSARSKVSPMDRLQKVLNPEWEIDYLGELSEKPELGFSKLMEELKTDDDNKYTSLQEMRFLQMVEEGTDMKVIDERLMKLKRYEKLVDESMCCLKPLSDSLNIFETELKKLSNQMEFLQKRSALLNVEIEEKKQLDSLLTPLINDLAIPPDIVRSIIKDPVNNKWTENLEFIEEKRQIYKRRLENTGSGSIPSCSLRDLSHLLDLLEQKCLERIRNYLVIQIKQLRRAPTASQLIQKEMLSCKYIFTFLSSHNSKLALELRQAYCYTMRWYYYRNFVIYLSSLEKLKLNLVDKSVLLGYPKEESSTAGGLYLFSHNSHNNTSEIDINEYLINIPKRFETLMSQDETAMLGQIAETNRTKYWIETGFKNFNQALMDNVSTEYLFLNEFFEVHSLEDATKFSDLIFKPIYKLGYNYTRFLINNTYDIFGCLIMVRLTQGYQYEVQHRRVPVLENYLNYQLMVLWPRFQGLIDENCKSVRKAASSSTLIRSISKSVMIPLSITQNFGMIITNLIRLSSNLMLEIETWEPLTNSVIRLIEEFENCITKLGSTISNKKKQNIFLYNNFQLIYTMLNNEMEEEGEARERANRKSQERKDIEVKSVVEDLEGKKTLAETERDHFKKLVDAYGDD